jgi:hypothetical protein
MIPKVVRAKDGRGSGGTGFKGAVEYVSNKAEHVETRHVTDLKTAPREMRAIAAESSRLEKPVYHFILSWAELERPTDRQMIEAADAALAALGLESHQAVLAVHRDRDHQHVHIVVNKRGLDGHSADLRNDFARLERVCREVELTQGWAQDRGRFEATVDEAGKLSLTAKPAKKPRGSSQADIDRERRTGREPLRALLERADLRAQVGAAFDASRSWHELHGALGSLGLRYEAKGSGATMFDARDEADSVSPSHIDKAWSRSKLEKRFGAFQAARIAAAVTTVRDVATAATPRTTTGTAQPDLRQARERLWQRFQAERAASYQQTAERRQHERVALTERHRRERDSLTQSQRQRRRKLDTLFGRRGTARSLFRVWDSRTTDREWIALKVKQDRERQEQRRQHQGQASPAPEWRSWLTTQARAGNADALAVDVAAKLSRSPRSQDRQEGDHTDARQGWMAATTVAVPAFLRERGIDRATVETYARDQVREDGRGNTLFAHHDQAGNVVGFEVKSAAWSGFAKGGQKTLAVFGASAARRQPGRIVIADSGVDALALAQIERRGDTLYVSTGGVVGRRTADELRQLGNRHRNADILLAFGRHSAGDRLADRVREVIGRGERHLPEGTDWTDALKIKKSQSHSPKDPNKRGHSR